LSSARDKTRRIVARKAEYPSENRKNFTGRSEILWENEKFHGRIITLTGRTKNFTGEL
jgi:hypothetical protein